MRPGALCSEPGWTGDVPQFSFTVVKARTLAPGW